MNHSVETVLILGAASPLGVALLHHLIKDAGGSTEIYAADQPAYLRFLGELRETLGPHAKRIQNITYDPSKPHFGFKGQLQRKIFETETHIYHLAHTRDRKLAAPQISEHNRNVWERVSKMARAANKLGALVVATDVGLAGDYRGLFSENWVDVGQVCFDAVDSSSLEVELMCLDEEDLPIVRARLGLLSDMQSSKLRGPHWDNAAALLLPSAKILKRLPQFLTIPTAVAKGALAPLSPTDWAAEALTVLANNPEAHGKAVHLVLSPLPKMEDVLKAASGMLGGPRVRGGLPVSLIERLGKLPGLTETARVQADHVASWWTPHRYCLSRNKLDITLAERLVYKYLPPPTWKRLENRFFEPI